MNKLIMCLKHFVQNKIFAAYLKFVSKWLVIPICILNTVLFFFFASDARVNYRNSIKNDALLTSANFDSISNGINSFANGLISQEDINMFFLETSYNVKNPQAYYDLRKYVTSAVLLNDVITNVSLFNDNYDYVFSVNSSGYLSNLKNRQWYESIPKNLFFYVCNSPNDSNILSYCYNIKFYNKHCGTIIIDVNKEKICKSISSSDAGLYIYLYDNDEILPLSKKYEASPNSITESLQADNSFEQYTNNNTLYTPIPLNSINGILISSSSSSFFSEMSMLPITYYLLTMLTLVIVIVILSQYSSFKLYTQILQFTLEFENLIIGYTTDYKLPVFEELSTKIISLKDANKQIEQKLLHQIDTIKKLQAMALQIQFNPHFLYNTLNSINTHILSITKKDCDATLMISNLAEILHHSLNTKEFFTTVEDEIYYCKKYTEIELIKHKNSFDVIWDIPDRFYNQQIVKMCIQPILENALKHGVLGLKDKRGSVTIRAYNTEHNLIIKITNNGAPIKKNELYELRELMQSETLPETKHIGLLNINQRIKLAYGNDYTIKISSNNENTSFYLKFPIT
ncbi:MAG: histidine kinase [Clostridia bacterium]|nr:histidine kinase [Clostridia bacterium]